MFEGFGPEKLITILLLALLFFGGKRIPEIGASLGKGIREFKRGIKDVGESINEPELPPVRSATALPPGVSPVAAVVHDDAREAPKRLI
ncbi:MAG TPA: twin-arginine translocase TatA/TatE family subunit [Gemmatimonadaceae bacterium]